METINLQAPAQAPIAIRMRNEQVPEGSAFWRYFLEIPKVRLVQQVAPGMPPKERWEFEQQPIVRDYQLELRVF